MATVPNRAAPAPDPPGEVGLPPRVSMSLQDSCLSYVRDRLRQVMFESYAGVPLGKFPEDLRMYEHLLWASRSNVVLEIGTNQGGSALWFRDRLATMAGYGQIAAGRVISIDLDVEPARRRLESLPDHDITLVAGDVLDPGCPLACAASCPRRPGAWWWMILPTPTRRRGRPWRDSRRSWPRVGTSWLRTGASTWRSFG